MTIKCTHYDGYRDSVKFTEGRTYKVLRNVGGLYLITDDYGIHRLINITSKFMTGSGDINPETYATFAVV